MIKFYRYSPVDRGRVCTFWKPPAQVAILAIGLGCLAPRAQAGSDAPDVQAAIQLLYDKQNIATANCDPVAALAYTSPFFIGVDDRGVRTNYHDRLRYMRNLVRGATFVQEGTVVRECTVVGNKAVVRVDDETRAAITRTSTVTDASTANDTWLRTPTGWKLLYRRIIASSVTVERHPAPPLIGPGGVWLGSAEEKSNETTSNAIAKS